MWRADSGLENYGYIHKTVNHSDPENPFVAPDGTHTQRIESQWRLVKRFFATDNYNNREKEESRGSRYLAVMSRERFNFLTRCLKMDDKTASCLTPRRSLYSSQEDMGNVYTAMQVYRRKYYTHRKTSQKLYNKLTMHRTIASSVCETNNT
ncbi:unnamed protein product [Euphydryas editha]|uniref:Uncharacterized protein n=1 Tax=Euphydryas editha TaxID=104508 RepID=A0AAU9U9Z7_EUPED|nr:unnamed protein product [Euphydryas editha]